MLWIIGLGIHGYKGLSIQAIDILKDADLILLEEYTSPMNSSKELEDLIAKKVKKVNRWYVEDGRDILELATSKNIALLAYGDPLIATTHEDLVMRAKEKGIDVRIIHNASAITAIIGEVGLHIYKVGRVSTIVRDKDANKSIYQIIYKNMLEGLHTLLLLEYDQEHDFFLEPRDALRYLLEYENEFKYGIIDDNTFVIIASRIGMDSSIYAGYINSLLEQDFGKPPHSIIVTGSLHFTEEDALKYIKLLDKPRDNSKRVRRRAEEMVDRYLPRAIRALEKAKEIKLEGLDTSSLLDNAERYINDARWFLEKKEYELAVLSIGYGEGLLDAIGYLKGIDLWES